MLVLVFDTETTGLPETKTIDVETLYKWPYIVQFSYIIYDTDLNTILRINDNIIKIPTNVMITSENSNIHGITKEMTELNGVNLTLVIDTFIEDFNNSNIVVAHNLNFDLNILKVEMLRSINDEQLDINKKRMYSTFIDTLNKSNKLYCTMQENIDLCNISLTNKFGKQYIKFPKLEELHEKLFKTKPKNLHNSLNDVLITLRCFIYIKFNVDLLNTSINNMFQNLF